MNWSDIAGVVGKAAPLVGTLLGGPAGGAVGGLIASALGTSNDPESVSEALKVDPDAVVKIKQIETEHKTRLQEMSFDLATTQIKEVNATMRAEASAEDKWTRRWRPFWGIISAFAFLLVVLFIFVFAMTAVWTGMIEAFTVIPTIIGAFAGLFSVPMVILGVSAHHRGKMQRVQAGEAPSPDVMKKALGGVKSLLQTTKE